MYSSLVVFCCHFHHAFFYGRLKGLKKAFKKIWKAAMRKMRPMEYANSTAGTCGSTPGDISLAEFKVLKVHDTKIYMGINIIHEDWSKTGQALSEINYIYRPIAE